MARTHRIPDAAVAARLAAEPRRFSFFQAVRLLEARARRSGRSGRHAPALVGEEAEPQQRAVAFRAAAHLSYPASEIHALNGGDPPEMEVNFIGLTGPAGILPQHYTVGVLNELRRRNRALRDFFDLLDDRLIAFFYRAWVKYRIPVSIERRSPRDPDGATETLRALIGFATDHLAERCLIEPDTLLHYAGLFSHLPRNAVSLQQLLIDYFGLPIAIEQFRGRWLPVPAEQRSAIGVRGRFAALGSDAAAGESYYDVQGNFAIVIGPIGHAEFLQFMPDGPKLDQLSALARLYAGPQFGLRVELILARREIPMLRLGADAAAPPRLGWNTWLRHYPAAEDARDAGWYL
jgi:type VI secretion system protein ImpH